MLEFLKSSNISNNTIAYMEDTFSEDILMALEANQYECKKIIALFRRLGVKYIDNLLIYETDAFLQSTESIVEKLKKFDITELVKEINEDYTNIEQLLYN